jgi:hypothetical protein
VPTFVVQWVLIGGMYLRYTTRKKDGKTHRYWRSVRSARAGRRVIQQTMAQLGELDEQGRLPSPSTGAQFDWRARTSGAVQRRLATSAGVGSTEGVRVERARQFGDVYLALALWRGCANPRASCTLSRTGTDYK